jgi:phosphoribosylamine--glycine ligase
LGPYLLAAARGALPDAGSGRPIATLPGAAVGVVLASAGYPDAPRRGDPITGLDEAATVGALVFHAGTARDPDGTYRSAGGRVLTVVARGADLAEAARSADRAADAIAFDGSQRRRDIARVALEVAR